MIPVSKSLQGIQAMTEIRNIKKEDNRAIAEIIRNNLKSYGLDIPGTAYFDPELDSLSDFYDMLPEKREYFVAVEDGRILGGGGMAEFSGIDGCAELQKLYLADEAKGKGIGRALFNAAENAARKKGYKLFYLETHHALESAIHLYEKNGFREIEKPAGVQHATMDRFFMKEL